MNYQMKCIIHTDSESDLITPFQERRRAEQKHRDAQTGVISKPETRGLRIRDQGLDMRENIYLPCFMHPHNLA